jgi:RNA polymerase sigma-70 factor, ECF subfamily
MTDAALVRRVRLGNRDAYRDLVLRYQDTLFRCALSMVHEHDVAADLVQSTFVNAYTRLSKLQADEAFGGWVYRMCVNRCRDHLKSVRRRDVPLDLTPPDALTARDRADAALDRTELRRALDGAMQTLGEEARIAFLMKHVEERSYEEMSELLSVTVPALKMRVHRAREALKMALQEVL